MFKDIKGCNEQTPDCGKLRTSSLFFFQQKHCKELKTEMEGKLSSLKTATNSHA